MEAEIEVHINLPNEPVEDKLELILPEAVIFPPPLTISEPVILALPLSDPSHSPVTPVMFEPSPIKEFAVIVPLELISLEAVMAPTISIPSFCPKIYCPDEGPLKLSFPPDPKLILSPTVKSSPIIMSSAVMIPLELMSYEAVRGEELSLRWRNESIKSTN